MKEIPTIAIVGRPNVGKSSLFNRLIGKKYAIVSEIAGTTRDRIFQKFECNGYNTMLVDTGGLEYGDHENIEDQIQIQAKVAIEDADLIMFLIDLTQELTVDDFAAANIIRQSKKPVILVANKYDSNKTQDNIYTAYELGFSEPVKVSAIHNTGVEELKTQITSNLKSLKYKKNAKKKQKNFEAEICILGKPNAGKSSLVNALFGAPKVIVSDIPGTTRDMTDTEIEFQEKKFNIIDTAGLRRRGKIEKGIEKFSSLRCMNAISRSDVVILVIDGSKTITKQDAHIVEYALEEEKGLIIAINKIDLLEGEEKEQVLYKLKQKFSFTPWAPVVLISATERKNIEQILVLTSQIMEERKKRVSTPELNQFLQKATHKHLPASSSPKKPKFLYATQTETSPPQFVLFFRNADNLHFSYPRYLENQIRQEYGFNGTAINLKIKKQESKKPGQ